MNHVRGPVHLLSHLHLPQPAFLRFYCYAIEHFFHVQFSPQRTFGGVVLHVWLYHNHFSFVSIPAAV
ncbi:unnamed protein product, partial [Aphis gossypii]